MDFLDILRSDGSIVVNKSLARVIGLDAAILFSEIVSKFKYHEDRKELTNGSWFYFTEDKLEENTTFKRSVQDKAIKKLVDLGLISKKIMGMPSKRFFTINKDAIITFLKLYLGKTKKISDIVENEGSTNTASKDDEKQQTCLLIRDKQVCSKPTTNNTNNNIKNNTIINNNHPSIPNDKIASLNISEPVKKIVRAYQDRLNEYDLKSIERLFKLEIVPNTQFEEVLATVLESNYHNLFKYLRKSLYRAKSQIKVQKKIIPFPIEGKQEPLSNQNYQYTKTKHSSDIPEWIQKQIENQNKKHDDQTGNVPWDEFLDIQNLLVQLGEISIEEAQQIIIVEKLKRNKIEHTHETDNIQEIKMAY